MFFSRANHTLHFDGSHNNQANKAGAGCIIRDEQGDLVVAATYNLSKYNLSCYNVAIAEAMGLKNGLMLAQQRSLKLNVIKGDNKEVIDHVLGHGSGRLGPALAAIISDIKGMLDVRVVVVQHIDRADNKVADMLASMGSSLLTESKVFLRYAFDLPRQVVELINQEKVSSHNITRNDGEESSGTSNIVKIGGALAVGAALLGFGYSMLSSGESSSNSYGQQKYKSQATDVQKALNSFSDFFTNSTANTPTLRENPGFTNSTANTPTLRENPGFFTIQYFGSDRNQLQKARAGCIIRNRGAFVIASAHNLDHEYPDCHVAIAEAIALKMGLKLAKDENIRLSLIQGRNVEVRDRVLGRERKPPRIAELGTLIQEIKFALYDQQIDPDEDDDKLELVEEGVIGVARALATVGGTLEHEVEIYRTIQDLPYRVAMLVNN